LPFQNSEIGRRERDTRAINRGKGRGSRRNKKKKITKNENMIVIAKAENRQKKKRVAGQWGGCGVKLCPNVDWPAARARNKDGGGNKR